MRARRRVHQLTTAKQRPSSLDGARIGRIIAGAVDRSPTKVLIGAASLAAVLAAIAAGPIAAAVAATYSGCGVAAWRRGRISKRTRREREAAKHLIGMLAADLRAGSPPSKVLSQAASLISQQDPVCRQIGQRVCTVRSIAERAGVPAAQLLDQLAVDLRAQARNSAALNAQTAGTVASARMLAGLPLAAVMLGEAIGAHPVALLTHTAVGAACVAVAVALQLLGLMWTRRIEHSARSEWMWAQ